MSKNNNSDLFENIKNNILNMDPVYFVEKYLTLEGRPFALTKNGYKPFSDIYRYIGIKALENDSKPVVIVKGRQVGATTMASALEMYFMCSGLFGTLEKPPMRVMHAFPQLDLAYAYSKTKLNPMIVNSVPIPGAKISTGKVKSYIQSLLDPNSGSNDSLNLKQFMGGNHIWIESTGINADRIRGRQLSLDTDIPTPTGFIKLHDVKVGDQLFDENGNICNVIKLYPINISPESYQITFDDGTIVNACADHKWLTYTRRDRINIRKYKNGKIKNPPTPKIKTTKEILQTLKMSGENNHCIPNTLPLNYAEKDLLLDPYLLGLWLGDGDQCGRITSADPEIFNLYDHHVLPSSINVFSKSSFSKDGYTDACQYRVVGLTTKLGKLKLLQNTHNKIGDFYNKHIPEIYMRSSFEQRLALLQGLLDTDGSCQEKDQRIEISQVREKLAIQIYELILSLGIKAHFHKKESWRYNKQYKDRYCIDFYTNLPVFRMKRKLAALNKKNHKETVFKKNHRFIKEIIPIDPIPMRCLEVDSSSHLFLITNKFIPTHNSADIIFYDECFPYSQNIKTDKGKVPIGKLYDTFIKNEKLPMILTFNEKTEEFEYKNILNAWKREKRNLFELQCENRKIKCTGNHRFLTTNGWKKVEDMEIGDVIKTSNNKPLLVSNIKNLNISEIVYDIEVEDNHNFIVIPKNSKNGLIAHNCQDISGEAIGNSNKILAKAKYGKIGDGVQVYFGTPKQSGSVFWEMWNRSSQQYFYLGCEKCKEHFPLYTPGNDEWENIWTYGYMVKCTKCGTEQNKADAAERGKWIALKNPDDCDFIGFHMNQLYIPDFPKEKIIGEKPGNSASNTERAYQNEVLGEFYKGDASPITVEEIREKCAQFDRGFRKNINSSEELNVYMGADWGGKADLAEMAKPGKSQGQSYSCLIVLVEIGPNLLSIDFACKLQKNDLQSKRDMVEEVMRRYSVKLAVGDIGYSNDLTEVLQQEHGDKFLASQAMSKINDHIKYDFDSFPKCIKFERDFYIAELFEKLKRGEIKFPFKNYEQVAWLISHCCSMEIKPTMSRNGEVAVHYVKGSTPNDGFMALLNAYIAYKFHISNGFKIKNPNFFAVKNSTVSQVPAITGYIPRM